MTLLQMQYILEIDRCGSMNKAAQRLFCSQSALSSAIVEVERELGITIFHRSNRGISLTEDGRALVGQITPIVEQSRKLSRYYASRRAESVLPEPTSRGLCTAVRGDPTLPFLCQSLRGAAPGAAGDAHAAEPEGAGHEQCDPGGFAGRE